MRQPSSGLRRGKPWDRTLVMGIVNVTPDSFSDGGRFFEPSKAIERAYQCLEEGADLIDVGAESTRPGAVPQSHLEEWRRLQPVLLELCGRAGAMVSVDTYHARTAALAIEAGATVINDIWGGLADPDMLRVVADAACTYVWMHNRRAPARDAFAALQQETLAGIERCLESGIEPRRLWIDPGIGFGKTYEDNLSVLKRLDVYCEWPYPVLLGTSRKRVIGQALDALVDDRLEGTLATVSLGVLAGVRAVRVHDVRAALRTCRMLDVITHAN